MTLEEIRADEQLVAYISDELKNNRVLGIILEMLKDTAPWHFTITSDDHGDVSPTAAALELGKTKGYALALDRIYLAGKQKKKQSDAGPTTYEKPPQPVQ